MKKKIVVILVVLIMVLNVSGECMVALAAEEVWEVKTIVKELDEAEVLRGGTDNLGEDNLRSCFDMKLRSSYIEKVLQCTHDIYVNGKCVFSVEEVCTVWYYSDGKVHLYRRTLRGISRINATKGLITYGSIVNTDGSYSYTSGDKVSITQDATKKKYALDFYVTGSDYNFSMYESN